jgi:hypothetical protein
VARSKGFSKAKQRVMRPLASRGGRSGGVRVLSSEDSKYVGRPGYKLFAPAIESGKKAVNRLMVRDPAKGISNEDAAQHIHLNADPKVDMVEGVQSPEIMTSLPLPPSSFSSRQGGKTIANKGVNRNIKKR